MNDITRIDPAIGSTTANAEQVQGSSRSPRFQELLERLQKLAADQRDAGKVDNAEELKDALRTADDGFVAAMDLRRQLEEAFKKHMP